MPDIEPVLSGLALLVVVAPALLLLVLGITSLFERPLSEAGIGHWVRWTVTVGLLSAIGVFIGMLITGDRHVVLDLGNWVSIASHTPGATHDCYHFQVKLVFDRLSIPFVILSLGLCGTIGAFAIRYMHREPGFNRFFVLFAVFVFGMVLTSLAGTIETLFTGWEMVGLSSVLLVAFFHERPAPCRNGLRVWIVYRISDAALLLAAIIMHHIAGGGDFDQLLGAGLVPGGPSWPDGEAAVSESQALVVGLLLLIAVAGKSALVPFSGWLPRAMEGPTPSSAVFYGALSVHLGAYLLLRVSPLLDASPMFAAVVVVLGLLTALFAYLAASVQTDIKSALSFASLTQVGIIVAEIGFGWRYIPLVHLLGHACLRTLQFIRAPTLLQDYRHLENAIGGRLHQDAGLWVRLIPRGPRVWLYRLALERGYLDILLTDFIATPFVKLFRWFDRLERRATGAIAGREVEQPAVPTHIAKPE
jgi:NADH:ubiquinone oxidoreductase subunit 5 (subunit L)/multisubunit Na+/H+ antiporter MnhA subunit